MENKLQVKALSFLLVQLIIVGMEKGQCIVQTDKQVFVSLLQAGHQSESITKAK
jgi:hypothetical protein